jgi:hypothetical protein
MYFPAAAVATRFLEVLSPNTCRQSRKTIVEEDRLSVARPITHAQAFIPFCIENPALHVERRVDIWYTEFVHRSAFYKNDTSGTVASIATWINEVRIVYQLGMPASSFNLVLHGPSERADQQLYDAVIRAAIWQDGATEIARREQRQFYHYCGEAEDFVDVIKDMKRGRYWRGSTVRWARYGISRESYANLLVIGRMVLAMSFVFKTLTGQMVGESSARDIRGERVLDGQNRRVETFGREE